MEYIYKHQTAQINPNCQCGSEDGQVEVYWASNVCRMPNELRAKRTTNQTLAMAGWCGVLI